ncbi:hypothetical protein BGW39_004614, partial [Mortierella sp. 14UC]
SDPVVTTTTSSGTIITPTLPPLPPDKSGSMSSGAIVGIVIVALLALITALISAFLIKRRRKRRFNQTSDTFFNPVNNNATLTMQENEHYHPFSATRKDYPHAGAPGGLRGRESVEPLNAHTVATSMLAGGVGGGDGGGGGGDGAGNRVSSGGASDNSRTSSAFAAASGLQDSLYPYEADPGYMHSQYYHPNGVSCHPPTEPTYSQYGDGVGGWNEASEYSMMSVAPDFHTDAEAAAYTQYEQDQQDMYFHQLMMQQHQQQQRQQQDLHAPVEYFDPRNLRTSTDYYPSAYPQPPPSSVVMNQSQPMHESDRSALVSLASGSVASTPRPRPPIASAMAPAPLSPTYIPTTTTATTPSSAINSPTSEPRSVQQYYDDTENDAAYTAKSDLWESPKRNPQVLAAPTPTASDSASVASADQIKVPVSRSPYAADAMARRPL